MKYNHLRMFKTILFIFSFYFFLGGNDHISDLELKESSCLFLDNNLGPDRLAGPKALDPIYCRQPIL